jgi:Prolyl oligopeptidase family
VTLRHSSMRALSYVALLTFSELLRAAGTPTAAHSPATADQLPQTLAADSPLAASGHGRGRAWTTRDIIELRDITETALSERSTSVAFVVKQLLVEPNVTRYALYVAQREAPGPARKLLESPYLADLSWHRGTDRWSVRADLGDGVQLYDVDDVGQSHPVVTVQQKALIGGEDGVIGDAQNGSHNTGVLSYEWAPDGKMLWYSRLRLRSPQALEAMRREGIVYDSRTMIALAMNEEPTALEGIELHLLDPVSHADTLLAFAPSSVQGNRTNFWHEYGGTQWSADGKHIQYMLRNTAADGETKPVICSVDVSTGKIATFSAGSSVLEAFYAIPLPNGDGHLTIRAQGDDQHLISTSADGKNAKDYGAVKFTRMGSGLGAWWDATRTHGLIGVHFRDHDSLIRFPLESKTFIDSPDELEACTFDQALKAGVCVRQTLTTPPELVSVSPVDGKITTLVRPNASYDAIEPLRSERAEWKNKYDIINDGYITYPRGYIEGKRYPTLIVTHGSDAQNKFAYSGFQWDYPLQVFAERGYLVLSVNDPRVTARTRGALNAYAATNSSATVDEMQFETGFNAVASMEAALQSVIASGKADPDRTGIAGYSRGAILTRFVLSQSKLFKVGAGGDSNLFDGSNYWVGGVVISSLYRGMFGGSPNDPAATESYRRFSPSFRAKEFAGPLLQQTTAHSGPWALELHTLLGEAHVPTELVFYPNETHLFHEPRHRAAAMELNLQWFDYWLLGKRHDDAGLRERYARWDAMAAAAKTKTKQ